MRRKKKREDDEQERAKKDTDQDDEKGRKEKEMEEEEEEGGGGKKREKGEGNNILYCFYKLELLYHNTYNILEMKIYWFWKKTSVRKIIFALELEPCNFVFIKSKLVN